MKSRSALFKNENLTAGGLGARTQLMDGKYPDEIHNPLFRRSPLGMDGRFYAGPGLQECAESRRLAPTTKRPPRPGLV